MAENYVYGVNLPASQLKTVIADIERNEQGVSTWNQILGANSLGYQKQQSALTQQYGDVITEAYKAHLGANNEIANLGLNEAQRAEQLGLSALDLENTYNKYISSFAQDAQTLADQYSKNISAIDNVLTEEAENYSKLLNSAYTYLSEELVSAANDTGDYLTNSFFNKYIKDGKLMSQQELYGNYLFTPEGQLTNEGREFFDAIYNIQDLAGYQTTTDNETFDTRSFDKWLSDTDIELRNFFASVDPYNFNFAGTRKGTLQQMLGMESTDNSYGGIEEYRIDNTDNINTISTKISDVKNKINSLPNDIANKLRKIEEWEYTGEKSHGEISRAKREVAQLKNKLEEYKELLPELEKELDKLKAEHNTYKNTNASGL